MQQIPHNHFNKSMNLSQPNPPPLPLLALSASLEQGANGVVELPSPSVPPFTVAVDILGYRKKFLDPSSLSFSSLSKPAPSKHKTTTNKEGESISVQPKIIE